MTQWSNPATPFPFCWLQTSKHARSWSQLINTARMLPTARPTCQPTCDKSKRQCVHICIQNIPLHSCLSRCGLQSFHLKHEGSRQAAFCNTPMIANTRKVRWWGSRHLLSSKRAPSLSVCLSDGLAGWLVWQLISTSAAVAATASHNNCWLGSWSQLLAVSQQPVCSTPLIYVH